MKGKIPILVDKLNTLRDLEQQAHQDGIETKTELLNLLREVDPVFRCLCEREEELLHFLDLSRHSPATLRTTRDYQKNLLIIILEEKSAIVKDLGVIT